MSCTPRSTSIALAALALVVGCTPFKSGLPPGPTAPAESSQPAGASATTQQQARGLLIARDARALLGTPYRYGGNDPRSGFDCSGLVVYVHRAQGLQVPRTAAEQHRVARPLPREALRPGDVVFFRIDSRQVSHVGVYVGEGRFVHAPRSGRPVDEDRIDDPWYAQRWAGAGTFN